MKIETREFFSAKELAANKKHRQAIMTAAKEALLKELGPVPSGGINEEQARKIVLAISTDKIPAISIRWTV